MSAFSGHWLGHWVQRRTPFSSVLIRFSDMSCLLSQFVTSSLRILPWGAERLCCSGTVLSCHRSLAEPFQSREFSRVIIPSCPGALDLIASGQSVSCPPRLPAGSAADSAVPAAEPKRRCPQPFPAEDISRFFPAMQVPLFFSEELLCKVGGLRLSACHIPALEVQGLLLYFDPLCRELVPHEIQGML